MMQKPADSLFAERLQMFKQRIRNALDVWKDDLQGVSFHLDDLTNQ